MPPWEIAGAATVSGPNALVVGAGPADRLDTYAAELEHAAASVGRLLSQPPPRVVLVIPETWEQAGRMDPTGVRAGMAAVTSVAGRPGTAAARCGCLADAEVLTRLDPATRTAVFGHEAFHVATLGLCSGSSLAIRGPGRLRGVSRGGGRRRPCGRRRRFGRSGRRALRPDCLTTTHSTTRAGRPWRTKALTWPCVCSSAEYGAADVVAVYRAVGAGNSAGIDAALGQILGTDQAALTRAWRAELTSLAAR